MFFRKKKKHLNDWTSQETQDDFKTQDGA